MSRNCNGCFANCNGKCAALTAAIEKNCPFFKSEEQQQAEQCRSAQKLVDRGRNDLIARYKVEVRL